MFAQRTEPLLLGHVMSPVQEGSSDAVEQKNAVRVMLRSFFPERDCVTMVRVAVVIVMVTQSLLALGSLFPDATMSWHCIFPLLFCLLSAVCRCCTRGLFFLDVAGATCER